MIPAIDNYKVRGIHDTGTHYMIQGLTK